MSSKQIKKQEPPTARSKESSGAFLNILTPEVNQPLEYVKRKQDVILKDLDTAFSWYQHIESQISGIRSLTITLLLGYIGFLFTVNINSNAILIPLLIIPTPFILIEIYKRGHLIFIGRNIRYIEKIFMIEDENKFTKAVQAYVFRDLQLQYRIIFSNIGVWFRYMLTGFLDADAILWYIFIIISTIFAYTYFNI